jgi:pyrroline-5-carboxylate reductase
MDKIGFIGFGAMGSIMVEALVASGAIAAGNIILNTRTPAKLKDFATRHPGVEVAQSIAELVKKCERVFICTGTAEVKGVLTQIVRVNPGVHVITITGVIELACIESVFPGRVSKIMPTQIGEVGEGVTLVCHNAKALPADRAFIHNAFSKIGLVKEIEEDRFDLAADLSGCAPAFYTAVLRSLVETAQCHGDLSQDDIREISLATLHGTAKLLREKDVDFTEFIARVATPGGITEEGVKVLDKALAAVFDEMLTVTLEKRDKVKARMRAQYGVG